MNFKKAAKNISFLAMFSVPAVVVACSTTNSTNTEKNTETSKPLKEESVLFQTAQNKFYPLVGSLNQAVKIYNETQKGTENFLPVIIQHAEDTKANTETALATQVATKLNAIKDSSNPDLDSIPNIILNKQSGAFVVNQYDRLLDLSKSQIKESLLDSELFTLHNKLAGEAEGKIFSIPFDISSIDSLVFNLDIMKKIFEEIKNNGGTVDENSSIYKKVINADKEGNHEIPETKAWRYMKAKSSDIFKDLKVNDETFSSMDKILEFSGKVYDGLHLDPTLSAEIKAKLEENGRDTSVLIVDYSNTIYKKMLYANTEASVGNEITGSPEKYIYKLAKDRNNQFVVDYSYLNAANKDELQKQIKDTYNTLVSHNKMAKLAADSNKMFKSVYFTNGGVNNIWASWDIRTYDSAIAIAPHVGIKQSISNSFTKLVFAKNNEEIAKSFAKQKDVLWSNQIQNMITAKGGVFNEGGSSLVAIKTNDKRNAATVKFIEWLLTGKMPNPHGEGEVFVKDFIRDTSAYVVPTRDRVTFEEYKKISQQVATLQKQIDDLEVKANKTAEEKKQMDDLLVELTIIQGAQLSLEDLLKQKGMDLSTGTIDPTKKTAIYFAPNDNVTNKISSLISDALFQNTQTSQGTTSNKKTGDDILQEVLKIRTN